MGTQQDSSTKQTPQAPTYPYSVLRNYPRPLSTALLTPRLASALAALDPSILQLISLLFARRLEWLHNTGNNSTRTTQLAFNDGYNSAIHSTLRAFLPKEVHDEIEDIFR